MGCLSSSPVQSALGFVGLGSNGPAPVSPTISMLANAWYFGPIINGKNSSPNCPANPMQEGAGWGFDFPQADGAHYLCDAVNMALGGTMTAKFTISGTGKLLVPPNGGTSAPKARLYFQKAGDDWFSNGFRFWSTPSTLEDGDHELVIPLDFAHWSGVRGNTYETQATFDAARANVVNVGITFGADFAGHGLYASGPVHFSMKSFTVG